ncbi:SGNH/GDSL hydrolase family protein [Mycolicibacterium monacense]|uniref:Lysophospholipase n=3 Tax=Mycobacteriaceae TaxID=1762 RepID=A0AAD1IUQ5_MYCMB|nr:SGNH/GDSL hydrolase family protein [Mycolicibacterium monacense]ORB16955.1 lysophospholipase [Mycolicibacterium monacense DSM 44395]QHP86604.1 SGNH/GDSL hydrolase family protein [Mycolicibacterium monacense DSM 44395]BBZ60345.1 lysophospholipase [Mycolicibacterium monacense]
MSGYTRYVAIGDSQTEGLWDRDGDGGLIGFADRLAAHLDTLYPGIAYANLAVRGRRIAHVLDDQLPLALSMRPDLITVCIGMNDVTRPGRSFGAALADLDALYAKLAASGATVVTTMFPDITAILPVGRLIAGRVRRVNGVIETAAQRYGFRLVDLYHAESMREHDTWSADRVHGSAKGHRLFAAAAAEALGLPGSDHSWASAGACAEQPSFRTRAASQVSWTRNMFVPHLWGNLRGVSSGDGLAPRRPVLAPVIR